jgi:hypothetical protein
LLDPELRRLKMLATLQSSLKIGCVALALAFASSSGMAADPVRDSFDRMFNHEPSRATPMLPADAGTDPLIAAMVEPLRQWFAQIASATAHPEARSVQTKH